MERRPNGTGCVYRERTKKLSKPWMVKVNIRSYIDENGKKKRIRKTIGSYRTKKEALEALNQYHKNLNINYADMTMKDLYEEWSAEHYQNLAKKTADNYRISWKYCSSIYDRKIGLIKISELENILENGYFYCEKGSQKGKKQLIPPNTAFRVKTMLNLMFDYACEREYMYRNPSRMLKMKRSISKKREELRRDICIFTKKEVRWLWEYKNEEREELMLVRDIILISLYSGWRTRGELLPLELDKIDLEERVMYGGVKTESGKNRIVPIHHKIYPIVEKYYQDAKQKQRKKLFSIKNKGYISYEQFNYRFQLLMQENNMIHHPHETRHSFITYADESGMNRLIVQQIVGHKSTSVTEGCYTHRNKEVLKKEMEKFKIE